MPNDPPRYDWTILRAGRLLLDGGGMFGVIPKVVWSRLIGCDDRNRIELRHNCLLLTRRDGGSSPDEPGLVLIEAGTGDKLDDKMSGIFGLDGRTVESEVRAAGVDPEQIGATIVSHLHFDHAGGLTRRMRDGEEPDWLATREGAASGDATGVKLTFPNAQLIVQRREWVDARANDALMTRTYYRDHLLPFEAAELATLADGRARMRMIDSPRPFPLNRKPGRAELPKTTVQERATEVLPGINVFLVPGHTWGQQAVAFTDASDRRVVFTPDVMPTVHHAGAAYSLSYDVESYTSMVTKRWFLDAAAEGEWLLVLDHEPGNPCQTVHRTEKGWYELRPATP